MRVGVVPSYEQARMDSPEFVARFAELAEGLGFESLWVFEHMVVPRGYESQYPYRGGSRMPLEGRPIPDPLVLLGFVAAVTKRIKLGTSVALNMSKIPFNAPVASVRVGRIKGSWILNPTFQQLEYSDLDIVVAGTPC